MISKEKFFSQFDSKTRTPAQQLAMDNCIAIFLVGSHLYGTSTPESDRDYEGIFIEPPEYVIGNKSCLEVDFSTKSPNKNSARNTPKDIDCKMYSLKNFFYLAIKNNPNKLEQFFIPERNIVYCDDIFWPQIAQAKDLFLSLKIKHTFTGYANSQKSKLLTKKKRLEEFRELVAVIETKTKDTGMDNVTIGDIFPNHDEPWPYRYILKCQTSEGTPAIRIQDKEFNYVMDVKRIYENVTRNLNAYGHRTLSLDTRDYDDKFASHLFRLYYEGLKLLKEGHIQFPLEENKFLLAVKRGEYDLDYILKKADEFEPLFEMAYLNSKLPHGPKQEEISQLQTNLYLTYWKNNGLY